MAALTSAPHVAFFMSFWILSLAADPREVKVGEDVTLQCQAPRNAQVELLDWIRPDLESAGYIFRFIPGESTTENQHPLYRGRVELRDPQMKGGDVSVVLKNVNINDTGTYLCKVRISGGGEPKLYNTIQLTVSVPGSPVGLIVGLTVLLLLLVVVAVVGVWKSKRPGRDIKRTVVMVVPGLPGDNAILRCQADDSSIIAVEWSRADLKPDTILSYRDKWLVPSYPHPDYKEDKVQLEDKDLKKGNMSLILRNVSRDDQGTYECRVTSGGSRWRNILFLPSEPIRIIHLQVTEQDLIVVTAHPGEDATLPCQDEDPSISDVEWSRADLESDTILSYRDKGLVLTNLHPDYKEDKVQLVDRDLKKGNMSLVLRKVSTTDQGTYKCRVTSRGSMWTNTPVLPWETTTIICLYVIDPADPIEVTVQPGDDVILPFEAAHFSIRTVQWSRADLKPDIVLLYYDGDLYPSQQHPSFKDRVELVDRDLEDGDVSLILKKVSRDDAGTYKCRVTVAGSEGIHALLSSGPMRTIRLQVPEPADLIVLTVRPGDDVILPCQAADSSINDVEWTRPDLKPDTVLYYSDGCLETDDQHPSFKDRVELVDRDLKDGDVSLILKNVSSIDNGTYKCRVITGYSDLFRTIRTIRLQVADLIEVVHPGNDALLQCRAADSSISVLMWSKLDLGQCVFLYRDGNLDPYNEQHPFFKGRVEVMGIHKKDGDVSLNLKNVSRHDAGRYECRVKTGDSEKVRIIRIIHLQVADESVVTVHPGEDAILPCQAADPSISVVVWSRPDLKPDTVLYYRDVRLKTTQKHPSFKDRVELVDRDLKDRDVSLKLKNVSRQDAGRYKCEIKTGIDSTSTRILHLQVADKIVVTVCSGDDAILPCQAADPSISVVEWSRPDLKPDTVLLYSDVRFNTTQKQATFKDRVELVDRDLKDRDVSLKLKNVSRQDAGRYKCRVITGIGSDPIRIINLQVADESVVNNETDDRNGTKEDINSDSLINIPLLNHPSAGYRASRSREDRNSSHVV